jgi:formylglycine-generating enzyme required for sulfatase activity
MDHCSGGGVCLHEQSPGSCLIDGICYEDGADHPTNECQHCDSVFDSNGWRNKTNGLSCSTSDQCFSGACVDCANDSGCSDLVDDGLECSAPACDTNTHTCVHDLAARLGQACGDSSITACNIADTCDASGVCQPNYEPDGTNCDDGNICNGISTCASGQCGQTTAPVVCTTAHPACDPSTGLCVCAAGYHDESGLCVTDGYTRIFSGIYSMGSPADELGREPENETKHQVTLTYGFEMRTTEVTQEEFGARMNYSPSYFGSCGTNCPVEQVSWHEACAYANALSVQKGYSQCFDCVGTGPNFSCTLKGVYARPQDCPGFRLPTEAEWEYAARAGSATAFYPSTGNDGTISDPSGQDANLDRIGWYSGNSSDATHPVGDKAANAWGLYDVSGNVYEWVWDIWNGVDYGSGSVVDPTGPTVATGNRGFRGAGYDMAPQFARSAKRDGYYIEYRARDVGFRPVRTLERNGQAFRQGDTCANPFIVDSNPYRLENVDISLFQPDLQTGEKPCTGYANAGRDVVFFVPLEAGQTVSAVVTADYDAALYIVQDCIDMVCLAGSDDNLAGESETVTYTATAKTTVYIVVDHYSSDGPESGLFTITISR